MKFDMVMPKMGESITEGTILKWLKGEGEKVEKDEIILEISTDKVDSEIPAPVSGILVKHLAKEGDTVDVGIPIAQIESDAGVFEPESLEKETLQEAETVTEPSFIEHPSVPKPSGRRFYSPVVMNIATDNDIPLSELDRIPGSGLNGRLTKKDILSYIGAGGMPSSAASPAEYTLTDTGDGVEVIPMDHIRKSIARHMVESKQTSAHVSLYSEADLSNVVRIRDANKTAFEKKEGFKLTYIPFIAEATVRALKEFPLVNASIDNDRILLKKYIHLGIAVAVDYGLIVPNIFHAEMKNITGLARSVNDLADRARRKKLKPEEVQGGTFSISNFGMFGTTIGFPIINQPQVAILGVGALKKKPVVISDAIAIRPMMYLSLTFDHRLIDGATGAKFLQRICEFLESYDPELQL